jgi:hypothetical protein
MSSTFLPISASLATPLLHAEFTTHLNYVKCMNHFSTGMQISSTCLGDSPVGISSIVQKKKILVDLTKENLDSELSQVNSFLDYSQICISWVPVKSYYLFFNLLILLLYLITGEEKWLTEDHKVVHKKLKNLIRTKEVNFNISIFSAIYSPHTFSKWEIRTGNNVVVNNLDYKKLAQQLVKKMYCYSKDDYKRRHNLRTLRGKENLDFMNSTTINLCEFFYWYRIKANYRDMEFVTSEVDIRKFYAFYLEYYTLTNNFYIALTTEINRLSVLRFGNTIFDR